MRFVDLIEKKKKGIELSVAEINEMITEYMADNIPEYQMSAMLMAICFQGMTKTELGALTLAMANSGEWLDLSPIKGVKVDKHSTGGVGDKATLVVAPIVAASGVLVGKMSGRGLGHTGGTIDKLESIPGFRTDIQTEHFFDAVNRIGICITGQTKELAPADKRLYALRDVTATVESIPLIAASIMSKKLAAGCDKILLDVTCGSGAFMKEEAQSVELAQQMVEIGKHAGKETVALITGMDEPLGYAIGNNLEVKEAIDTLKGNGPEDLVTVSIALAADMIQLAFNDLSQKKSDSSLEITIDTAKKIAKEMLTSGKAYQKFLLFVKEQGGDTSYIENPDKFEKAKIIIDVKAEKEGYLYSFDTEQIGVASAMLGAGREKVGEAIDASAGIILHHKVGDYLKMGDTIATLYTSTNERAEQAGRHILENTKISKEKPASLPLIRKRVV